MSEVIGNPLVSVVIPAFNVEKYIEETINSILTQKYRNIEIIVVNDGSTDSTFAIVETLMQNNSCIRLFSTENNGVSAARNFGFCKSLGKYIVFFDADDIMLPFYVCNRVYFLERNTDYIGVSSKMMFIDGNGQLIQEKYQYGPSENSLEEILFYDKDISSVPSNLMYRKNNLENKTVIFDINLSSSADKLFLINVSIFGKLYCLRNQSDLSYRIHKDSMYNNPKKLRNIIKDNTLYVNKINKLNFHFKHISKKVKIINHLMIAKASIKTFNFDLYFRFLFNTLIPKSE